MNKRILLLGGTFDPVHCGHMVISLAAAEQLDIERIWLLPAAQPPHKTTAIASTEDRVAMLQLAIDAAEGFEICDVELRREGPSYTVDTLTEIHARLPDAELHWLIGADMLAYLPKWYRVDEVVELVQFAVADRRGDGSLEEIFAGLTEHFPSAVIDRLRAGVIRSPLIDISSSDIRRRVAAGEPVEYLVGQAVADYIAAHGLYR